MNHSSNSLFNVVLYSSQQGKSFCFHKKNKTIDNLLYLFKELGFIYGFTLTKKNVYQIFLKQDKQKQPTIKKIIIWSTQGKQRFVSAFQLSSLYFKDALAETLIVTDVGIINAKKALKLNLGGLVLCRIIV
jgi:ribosomal protein S8